MATVVLEIPSLLNVPFRWLHCFHEHQYSRRGQQNRKPSSFHPSLTIHGTTLPTGSQLVFRLSISLSLLPLHYSNWRPGFGRPIIPVPELPVDYNFLK